MMNASESRAVSVGFPGMVLPVSAREQVDQLAEAGVVGPEEGTKPRKVLMTKDEFEQYLAGQTKDQG